MEYTQYLSDVPNSDTIYKTPITYLKKILDKQGILNQLIFESVQSTWILHSRRFQFRVTDGRFVAFGIGESNNEAKENAAKSLLRVILKEFPELYSEHSKESHNTNTSDSNVTNNSENLLNADEYNRIALRDERENNSIGLLQELCVYFNLPSPIYILESSEGPLHNKVHTISCSVLCYVVNGIGTTRSMAKRNAADKLYLRLKNMPEKYLQNLRNRRNHRNQNIKVAENTNAVGFVHRKFSRVKKNCIQKPATQKKKVNSVYRSPDNINNLKKKFTSNRVDKQNQVNHTKDFTKNLVNHNIQVSEHNDMAVSDDQKSNNFTNIPENVTKYPADQLNQVTENNDKVNFAHQETSNFITMAKDFTQNPIDELNQQKLPTYIAGKTRIVGFGRRDYFPFSNSWNLKNAEYTSHFNLITSIPRTILLAEEHFFKLIREMLIRFYRFETNPILNCVCGVQGLEIILSSESKQNEPTFKISTYTPIAITSDGIAKTQLDVVHKIMEYFHWIINNRNTILC